MILVFLVLDRVFCLEMIIVMLMIVVELDVDKK